MTENMKHLKALIVEDSDDDTFFLLRHLKNAGYEVEYERVETAEAMEQALEIPDWQIVLSDYSMPRFDGLRALALLKQNGSEIPFIMISGTIGEDTAVRAMLAGADDYFIKGHLSRLAPAIERELKEAENRRARLKAEAELEENKIRLQLALQAADLAVWEWNVSTDQVYWSPEVYRIMQVETFGGTLAEYERFVHPDDFPLLMKHAREAVENHTTLALEFRMINPKGEIQWIAKYARSEYAADGTPLRLIGTMQDITARKVGEEKLRESEEYLNTLMHSVEGIVWEVNADTYDFLFVSQPAERILGYPVAKWYEKGFWLSRLDPRDLDHALSFCRKCTEEKRDHEFEYRMVAADGRTVWLRDFVTVVVENDRVTKLRGIMVDITERKLAEERIRISEENFRALVQASTQFIWTADSAGFSPELFDWFSKLSGRTIESLADIIGLIHPEDFKPARAAWMNAFKNKTLFNYICRYLNKDNEYCYLATRSIPMFNPDGSFRQWVGTFNDITERLKAEEALRKNEFQLRVITDTVPAIIGYISGEECCQFANKSFCDFFAHSYDEVVGKPLREIISEEIYQSIAFEIEAVLSGKEMSFERTLPRGDDNLRFVRWSLVPDFDESGTIQGFFAFGIDLTENKRSEERLRQSEEQLRQAQKLESVGRLAGGIAHDFNNMLTAINGYSDLTLRRLDKESPLRHNIEEIKKAGERSAALTQQLLTFSRLQILQVKRIDINQVISDSIVMLQRLIGEDILIDSTLHPNLEMVEADPGQISQLLLNLAVNSRDAMPQGGTITIKTDNVYLDREFVSRQPDAKAGQYVLLSVSDTGCGIDEETKEHIFEPFFTTKAIGKGTGLGLSTVYGIVKQSNGIINLESAVGEGTIFEIYLPSVNQTASVSEKISGALQQNHGDETILLVEDEEIVRNLSRQILESCGYQIIEARDGMEALVICIENKQEIDLLITDVVMPLMSGRELAEKIAKIQPEIKILFTSGYTDDQIVQHGLSENSMNFIQKPFTFDQLANKVRDILDKNKAQSG